MFRAATVLRSAPRAAAAAVAPLVARRTIIAPAAAARPAVAAVAARAVPKMGMAVRWYSAGGPLNKEEVEGRIMNLLQGFDKVNDVQNIKPAAHFANDLGLDSLDTVEVVMAIEEEFSIEIPDKDADNIHSVDNAVQYILNQPDAH